MKCEDNLNAIDDQMVDELKSLLEKCDNAPEVKVIVLNSSAKAFSAGGDIKIYYNIIKSGEPTTNDAFVKKVGRLTLIIKKMKKIVITSVNGVAAGAGANLALSGDFILADKNAKFIQAFINLGLVPDTGGAYLLSKLIGPARTLELCATGRPLSAEEAKTLGIVTEVFPKETLLEDTLSFAEKIAKGPTLAYENLKKQIFASNYTEYEAFLKETEVQTQHVCMESNDFKEGVCAFFEKRPLAFEGK